MADVRISNLAAAVAANLDGNSLVPTTDSEGVITTVKVSLAQMRTSLLTRANGNFAATDYLSLGGASPPATGWIRVDGTTVTTSTPILSAVQTWNDAAVTFTGFLLNVTSTASAAASLLVDLQVAAASKFKVNRSGDVTTAGNMNTQALTATTGLFTSTITAVAITTSGLITANAGATITAGQTLTVTGATITGLTAASVGTGTFPGVYTITGAVTLSSTLKGASTISVGAATPAASGQGLTFADTPNASTDVNTIDYYKEIVNGFTPSLGGSTTYTSRSGSATKIGRQIDFDITIVVNAIGTGSTSLISGLPYPEGSGTGHDVSVSVGYFDSIGSSLIILKAVVVSGSSTVQLWGAGGATPSLTIPSVFKDSATVRVFGRYYAAS